MLRSLIIAVVLILVASAEDRAESKRTGPAAHYVIRSSDLKTTLDFLELVLGLRVLRHEENSEPCPITCNGDYAVPWSKTMVGTRPEDEAYALEVTYNYGVDGYERGTGLAGFDIYVDDVTEALDAAIDLGYAATAADHSASAVVGPDGYEYRLLARPSGRREPFRTVRLFSPDPSGTAKWYARTLGMSEHLDPGGFIFVAFSAMDEADGVVFRFDVGPATDLLRLKNDGQVLQFPAIMITQFDGRNALSLPTAQVRAIYGELSENEPERILHDLQEINEETGLGVLLILIITDPNGLELCLVSSEAFEPAIRDATDYIGPNYGARKKLALEYAERISRAKKQKPNAFGWAAEL